MNLRASFLAVALVSPISTAQEPAAPAPQFDVITFQAQASREVENDELAAVLAVQAQGADTAALSQTVNRQMAAALNMAADYPAVIVTPSGQLLAHWLQRSGAGRYAYDVRVAQSAEELDSQLLEVAL